MYEHSSKKARPRGMADADNPTAAQIARRRAADLAFMVEMKTATLGRLLLLRWSISRAKHPTLWRLIAIERALQKRFPHRR